MATPVPPDKNNQYTLWSDLNEGNPDGDVSGNTIPEPLKAAAQAYFTAMGNVSQWVDTNRTQQGSNWKRLVLTAQNAAAALRNEWEKNEAADLGLEVAFPEIPDIPEFKDENGNININFDDLGPDPKSSGPELILAPDDHFETNIENPHAWVMEKGIQPLIDEGKMALLRKLGIQYEVDENGDKREDKNGNPIPAHKNRNNALWVLRDDDLVEGKPPAGWEPIFADNVSPFPKRQTGQGSPDYLAPNENVTFIQENEKTGEAEQHVYGNLIKDLLTLKIDPEKGMWARRIANIIATDPEYNTVEDVIQNWINPGIHLPNNSDGSPKFIEYGEEGAKQSVYRNMKLTSEFFYHLILPYISEDHPEKDSMVIDRFHPKGQQEPPSRNEPPPEVMEAVLQALEESKIASNPAPWVTLRGSGGGGKGRVKSGEGAFRPDFRSLTGVAKHAQNYQSMKYRLLRQIAMRPEIRAELERHAFDVPPEILYDAKTRTWNFDTDEEIRNAYDLLEKAMFQSIDMEGGGTPGPIAVAMDNPANKGDGTPRRKKELTIDEQGNRTWQETGEPLTYRQLVTDLTGFIGQLKNIYEAGRQAGVDNDYHDIPSWEDATGGFALGTGNNASGYTVTPAVFRHLRDMGLVPLDAKGDPIRHTDNWNIPEDYLDFNGGLIPTSGGVGDAGIFAQIGRGAKANRASLQGAGNVANFRQVFKDLAQNNPEFGPDTDAGKHIRTHATFEWDPNLEPKEVDDSGNVIESEEVDEIQSDEVVTPPSVPEDPQEKMIRQLAETHHPEDEDVILPAYGMHPEFGEGPLEEGTRRQKLSPEKQMYMEHLRQVAEIDPNELKRTWLKDYHEPLMERMRTGKPIGTTIHGDADVDGKIKQENLINIRSAYKEMYGHDINEAELQNLTGPELTDYNKKITAQQTEYRKEMFNKEANDVSHLRPLSPENMRDRHAILQQYRKLYHHGEKYGEQLDDKDQGTPGTPGYKPSAKTQIKDLLYQIWNVDGSGAAQAMGLPIEFFTNDKAQHDELQPGYTYGSPEHIQEANKIQSQRNAQLDDVMGYYTNPNEGGALKDHIEYTSGIASDFAYTTPEGKVIRYNLDEPGSRMTYHNGMNRGWLLSDANDYEGVRMSEESAPEIEFQDSPHKIFGMTPELEEAYKGAYGGIRDLKLMAGFYGRIFASLSDPKKQLIPEFNEDGTRNPLYTTGPLMMDSQSGVTSEDLINYIMPFLGGSDIDQANVVTAIINDFQSQGIEISVEDALKVFNEDREMFQNIPTQIQEHQAVLQNAFDQGIISQQTFDTLNQHINYSDYDAKQAMLAEGHNNFGMPIDENGNVEETPMYMGNDGELHPRVYHRASKMWYIPHMVDDFRNRQGIGTFVNRPYDVISEAGLKMGQDGNGTPKYSQEENPDLYRFGIPSVNNTTHGNDDSYQGIFISRTGVLPIGTDDGTSPPSIDENGNLINHGGENGDQPLSSDDISRKSFAYMWKNSNDKNPQQFVDQNGDQTNIINMTSEGHVDGGWLEWLQRPIRKLTGTTKSALTQSGWRGPQTWSGHQVLKPEESKPPMTALQALRQYGTVNVPERMGSSMNQALGRRPGEKRTALRAFWDSINMSIPRSEDMIRRNKYHLGPISLDAAINQWQDGETIAQQDQEKFAENLRHFTARTGHAINPKTGVPYIPGDVGEATDSYLDAEAAVKQAVNDPRLRPAGGTSVAGTTPGSTSSSEEELDIPV